jgi:hypothetical protein
VVGFNEIDQRCYVSGRCHQIWVTLENTSLNEQASGMRQQQEGPKTNGPRGANGRGSVRECAGSGMCSKSLPDGELQ